MNNRFSEIVQKGTPPFIAGGLSYSADLPRNYNALTLAAYTNDGQEAGGFEAAVTELERARRHGFTQGELNRARAEMLSNFENLYKQKDKISNDEWASQIRDHFLTGEPLPSLDLQYDYYKKILPEILSEQKPLKLKMLQLPTASIILMRRFPTDISENIMHLMS